MARAAKVHCLEHGKDARRMTLFAYGGAGPVHGFGVAQILGVSQILYPCRAGVMSALGFLVAQPSFEILRGRMENLLEINLARLNALLREMEQEATLVVRKSVGQRPRLQVHREVAIRYEGQSYELYIPVATGVVKDKTLQSIAKDFSLAYSKRYQALAEHDRLESVRWRVRVSGVESMENFSFAMKREKRLLKVKERRLIYVPEKKRYVHCPVYDRYRLPYSALIKGPALIEERESTVYLGSYSRAHLTSNGDLKVIVEKKN
jgi:N-methylhydantoinase A